MNRLHDERGYFKCPYFELRRSKPRWFMLKLNEMSNSDLIIRTTRIAMSKRVGDDDEDVDFGDDADDGGDYEDYLMIRTTRIAMRKRVRAMMMRILILVIIPMMVVVIMNIT